MKKESRNRVRDPEVGQGVVTAKSMSGIKADLQRCKLQVERLWWQTLLTDANKDNKDRVCSSALKRVWNA